MKNRLAIILTITLILECASTPTSNAAKINEIYQNKPGPVSTPLCTTSPTYSPKLNPLKVKAKTAYIVEGPKHKLNRKKVLKIRNAIGNLFFKKIKGNKKIHINKKTGMVSVYRRLHKGTYRVKVAVFSPGDDTYAPKQVKVKLRIKVVPTSLSPTERNCYNNSVNWGLVHHASHELPSGSVPFSGFSLKKFNTIYYRHKHKKEIYLTFDCGYENGNTKKILDILKKKHVKALFFITKCFLEEQPGLVKRMKREGHLVGNHTMNHPYMSKCSIKRLKSEILGLEKLMKKKTRYKMDRYIRPPYGTYSIKSLHISQILGYKTVLWSLAWYDYDENNQPAVSSVVNQFKSRHHKGMIPLLHNTSSADTAALPEIISYMKKLKYKFCSFPE